MSSPSAAAAATSHDAIPQTPTAATARRTNSSSDVLSNFLMGGLAASVSKTAAAPIERVKLLVQIRPQDYASGGVTGAFGKVVREEGFKSLWRGNGTNVLRYFPTQALNFAFKDYFKTLLGSRREDGYARFFIGNVASGAAAGAAGSLFVYSMDYARTRLSVDGANVATGGQRQFKGLIDVYRQTLKSDGVLGLYRGFPASLAGIVVYRGAYFGLYDSLKPLLPQNLKGNPAANFVVGFGSVTAAGLAAYPLDTIRRRMMMTVGNKVNVSSSATQGATSSASAPVKYKNTLDAFRQVLAKEGAAGLMRGAGANILRGIAGAGALTLYDVLQELMFGKVYKAGSG